jgi:hypothetical protein
MIYNGLDFDILILDSTYLPVKSEIWKSERFNQSVTSTFLIA